MQSFYMTEHVVVNLHLVMGRETPVPSPPNPLLHRHPNCSAAIVAVNLE